MSVVASFDYINRRIYIAAATWHPIDVYREARIDRATNEMHRCCPPMVRYDGNVAKGGGKFTPRYMTMLQGAKIVPVDGSIEPVTTITGEIITDDQTEFIDVVGLSVNPLVKYQPPEAEVIEVVTSGGDPTAIANAVLARKDEIVIAADLQMFHTHQCDGYSMHELLQVMMATLFGKVDVVGNVVTFRNPQDTKSRVIATVTPEGKRLSVTLDASD